MIHKVILYLFMAYDSTSDRKDVAIKDSILIQETINHINCEYEQRFKGEKFIESNYYTYNYNTDSSSKNKRKYNIDFNNIVFNKKANQNTLSIFYYFGHGYTAPDSSNGTYNFVIDNQSKTPLDDYVTGNEIYSNTLEINKNGPTLIMINTCFDSSTKVIGDIIRQSIGEPEVQMYPSLMSQINSISSFSQWLDLSNDPSLSSNVKQALKQSLEKLKRASNQRLRYSPNGTNYSKEDSTILIYNPTKGENNLSLIYSFSPQTNYISSENKTSRGLIILCNLLRTSSTYRLSSFIPLSSALIEESTLEENSCFLNDVYKPILDIIIPNGDSIQYLKIRLQCWKK